MLFRLNCTRHNSLQMIILGFDYFISSVMFSVVLACKCVLFYFMVYSTYIEAISHNLWHDMRSIQFAKTVLQKIMPLPQKVNIVHGIKIQFFLVKEIIPDL